MNWGTFVNTGQGLIALGLFVRFDSTISNYSVSGIQISSSSLSEQINSTWPTTNPMTCPLIVPGFSGSNSLPPAGLWIHHSGRMNPLSISSFRAIKLTSVVVCIWPIRWHRVQGTSSWIIVPRKIGARSISISSERGGWGEMSKSYRPD